MNINDGNRLIMQEIGLTIDQQNRVIDQDSRLPISFKGKNMKFSSNSNVLIGHNEMVFNPMENPNMMDCLFGYFSEKVENEDNTYIPSFNSVVSPNGKTSLNVQVGTGSQIKTFTTNEYNYPSLAYVEAIQKINANVYNSIDEADYDKLKEFDAIKKPDPKKKKKVRFK